MGSDCPNCGGVRTLSYGTKDMPLGEEVEDTTLVEGMVCTDCDFFYVMDEEMTRYFNVRAVFEKSKLRFMLHDGLITQVSIH